MRVEVRAPCYPTENVHKVEQAMRNIFPDLDIRQEAEFLVGSGSSIEKFGELLKEQRIRSAARSVLLSSRSVNGLFFALSKQVAFVGKVSFGSGSPLGDIEVRIEAEDIDHLINSIAPRIEVVGE